jgi:RNA polymerase sigma-70 factor (ECF subfamily)
MDLLQRFAAGDEGAFESLFRQYQGDVYRWIVGVVRDTGVAEELTVETFWRAHRAHARFQAGGNFTAWLRRIATNLALDHLRHRRQYVALPEEIPAETKADSAVQQQTRELLRKSFAELPPRLRIVAQLGLVEDEPYADIAAALGISPGAAKLRMFRAVRLLRKKLQRWGMHP